ncbi:ribosomal protein S18 acetylase RimI-like enzyme [Sphingomonas vulcanisoli]|uniref:Ribosomal protein S18 acetylase RimI-like enzyme n=1 Tax=Sphingomonas vulcanisoli TaxID=1658060 RepID=A0ABX0TXH3_9SPHN|nr:GNAT family N-acetyltransferase [Sphingomonas vulcanisoli]NIJ08869.1 ribosomal protein S18 acetylase RimI-like enzyme [Sphingomonas vulcanisoli]
MGALIRDARDGDCDALHALVERAYRGDGARSGWSHEADILGGPRTSRDNLAESIADPKRCLMIAEEGGGPIGCVEITDKGGGIAYLGLLTVDPGLQQGGLGKQLLAAAEQAARDRWGADRIEMTVIDTRDTLIAYYRRRGYAITGETRAFPAVDGVIFLQGSAPAMTVLEKPLA